MKEKGIAQILAITIILVGIAIGVYLVQQHTNIFSKAAGLSQEDTNSIIAEEKKVAGIDENGQLIEDRAKFFASLFPEEFKRLKEKGFIPDTVKTVDPPDFERQEIRTQSSPKLLTNPDVDSCGEITASGNYALTKDIDGNSVDGIACLNIYDTSNVNIDCQGHSIIVNYDEQTGVPIALKMTNVQNSSIKNCSIGLRGYQHPDSKYGDLYFLRLVHIEGSAFVTVEGNTISEEIYVENNNNFRLLGNTINGVYSQSKSSFSKISGNKFKIDKSVFVGAVVTAKDGGNNIFEANTIDGAWNGDSSQNQYNTLAADDGIVIAWENGDTIAENTIVNNYDCGIETLGFIKDTKITGNKIINSGLCGIGGWYYHSWLNNTVDSNTVDGAAYMFYMHYTFHDPSRSPKDIYFQDNKFTNNKFLNQRNSSYAGSTGQYSSIIDLQNIPRYTPPDSTFHLANNTFRNNDFSENLPAPVLIPISMVVDQGDNKCLSGGDITQRPLICAGSVGSASLSTSSNIERVGSNWPPVSINVSLSSFATPGGSIAGLFVRNQEGGCSISDCGYIGWTQIRSYGTNGTDANSWTAPSELTPGIHIFAVFSLNTDGTAGQLLSISQTNFTTSPQQ